MVSFCVVGDIGLCCVFASVDVLCLLFVSSNQFHGSLFLLVGHSSSVPLPSSVSGCLRVLLLRSVTCSDLRFSLSDGVARWDESLMFLFAPSSSTPVISSGFCRNVPWFSSLFLYPGFSLFSSRISVWFPSALSVGECRSRPSFLRFFLSFGRA